MRRPKDSRSTAPRELVPPELVERCKAGDEVAWRELVEVTHREVYTLCLRILRDPDDAAEATQDAYLKAWRALKGFRGDAKFTTWLYRVAANTAISKHRSRKRRRSHETGVGDEVLGQIASAGSTEGAVATRIEMAALERGLALLPEHYRSAVVLRDVYGLSIEEIASQLKISSTAAKVRVHRGRKKLKEIVFTNGTGEGG
ncbi:MAG TPA: sigma-70 family RNA polymerase sigma factor [Actinomycetota bacterium]|nr:sigma-70 family RNA polymerase sigma factor [Actinomycetota bacterium]